MQTGSLPPDIPAAGTRFRENRSIWQAMWRGIQARCPRCGRGRLFRQYLKVHEKCNHCAEEFHHHRADDAPPYFTILIVGHLVFPLLVWLEVAHQPPVWVHMSIWIPLVLILSLCGLPLIKGAIIGLQWATHMHGFGGRSPENGNSDD